MLGENIKIIRKNKGYSQEELANKLHVTRQTVSKWETGQSVPDANLLKQLSLILEVSVAELMDGNAERIMENAVIVDQLSRVNENLILANKRVTRMVVGAVCVCIVVLMLFGFTRLKESKARGKKVSGTQHIGVLTYSIPGAEFYHKDNDIGVTVLQDGTQQISAKTYRCYEDMTEIGVWCYGKYTQQMITEFQQKYPKYCLDVSGVNGTLSSETEFFIQATDGGRAEDGLYYQGSFYQAYIVLCGNMYKVTVTGGNTPAQYGEAVVCSMGIDTSLEEEYWKGK